jgi:hypothetical protein
MGRVADVTMNILIQNGWVKRSILPEQNSWIGSFHAYVITGDGRQALGEQ